MCGRTACTLSPKEICQSCSFKKVWQDGKIFYSEPKWRDHPGNFNFSPSTNFAPSKFSPVIFRSNSTGLGTKRDSEGTEKIEYVVQPMMWGLIPPFYKSETPSHGLKTNNCRIEDIETKKSYLPSLKSNQRCVVICDGFYEWKTTKSDGSTVKSDRSTVKNESTVKHDPDTVKNESTVKHDLDTVKNEESTAKNEQFTAKNVENTIKKDQSTVKNGQSTVQNEKSSLNPGTNTEFYDKTLTTNENIKQPFFIHMPQRAGIEIWNRESWCDSKNFSTEEGWKGIEPLKMAGLYSKWRSTSGEEIYSYTILTMEPGEEFSSIHHRMPAILEKQCDVEAWLNEPDYKKALKSLSNEVELRWYPVSTNVNNSRNQESNLHHPFKKEEKQENKPSKSSIFMANWLKKSAK